MCKVSTADRPWYWRIALLAVTLFALGLRWAYSIHAVVDNPIRGDAVQYVSYAWNMAHHGAFSMSLPGSAKIVPDSFRDPGYPSVLACVMLVFDELGPWYRSVLLLQGLLGALTVTLLTASVRPWLGAKWSLVAGLLMAIWPHSITITGFLLSETATAFWVALAFFLLHRANVRSGLFPMAFSGIAFSLAALTNAVLIPFATLLALILWWNKSCTSKLAFVLALSSLLLPAAWSARSVQLPTTDSSSGRALLNAVQGSWPEYHASYIPSVMGDPGAKQIQADIWHEYEVLRTSPAIGMQMVSERMGQHPWRYAAWYASKPALLWDWSIRMGIGSIYVYSTSHSILDEQPILRATVTICRMLNPLIMALALVGLVLTWRGRRESPMMPIAFAALAAYVTVIYSLLQAEPRYAIPFRCVELILAVEAIRCAARWRATWRQPSSPTADSIA
ncbi:hypothetical protein DVT68_05010 [Dyella solisilvae]|uniref:Glycosyltransferase RgtA/B/C/D-like domain-containing protein n=1 Tax=Dyella solisilvae TaxID=1920168 RepID=A0A370KBZ1_9GAMM|nr:hypothetical protein [Dyella solisilvae]RDJ00174.1 hypothetical protein DVT68_05010 [Dyella solisilvae]